MVVKRDPDRTREKILQAAFQEVHQHGFRSASVDRILADTGLTKGALYHHFPNKAALGYAIVDEIIYGYIIENWLQPLDENSDPIGALIKQIRAPKHVDEICSNGCPLNNLAQEMSPIDETFRRKIEAVFTRWRSGIAERLRRGQQEGHVRKDIDCEQAATFIVAAVEGSSSLAKNSHDPKLLCACAESLVLYLEALRPRPAQN